jgi:molybdopterin/thiamine biosynthesis adenylyltransferase
MACPHYLDDFAVEPETQTIVMWSNSQRFVIATRDDVIRMMNAFDLSMSFARPSSTVVAEQLRDLTDAVPIVDYGLRLM